MAKMTNKQLQEALKEAVIGLRDAVKENEQLREQRDSYQNDNNRLRLENSEQIETISMYEERLDEKRDRITQLRVAERELKEASVFAQEYRTAMRVLAREMVNLEKVVGV